MAAEKPYLPVAPERVISGILVTFRCPKCRVALVESSNGVSLDTRHQRKDAVGVLTAAVHICETARKQRNPRKSDLWD